MTSWRCWSPSAAGAYQLFDLFSAFGSLRHHLSPVFGWDGATDGRSARHLRKPSWSGSHQRRQPRPDTSHHRVLRAGETPTPATPTTAITPAKQNNNNNNNNNNNTTRKRLGWAAGGGGRGEKSVRPHQGWWADKVSDSDGEPDETAAPQGATESRALRCDALLLLKRLTSSANRISNRFIYVCVWGGGGGGGRLDPDDESA